MQKQAEEQPDQKTAEENRRIADTVTCNNVLNVIDSQQARDNVILQAVKAIKEDGTAYFSVYEGDGTGQGKQTKSDSWQNNRKTNDYIDEIKRHFDDVTVKNKVIIARKTKAHTTTKRLGLRRNIQRKRHPLLRRRRKTRIQKQCHIKKRF